MATPTHAPTPRKSIRIAIVEDHPIVRRSLISLIEAYGPPFEVCGSATHALEAVAMVETSQPDVVLTDLHMPAISGIDLIGMLKARHPSLRYVVFTASTQEEHMLQAFDAGASGYVVKESEEGEVVRAIEAVASGYTHFPDGLNRALDRRRQKPTLTPREAEVLALIAQGLTSKAIARKLDMDYRTVDTHRARIRQRFGLESSAALLRFAIENQNMP